MPTLQTGITAGATGHITDHNQIHGKLNDIPNVVRDYGAVGNDSTNNTSVLQAAIDAVYNVAAGVGRSGGLFFPSGIYRTDQLTMRQGVQLIGEGHPGKGGDTKYGAHLSARANGQRLPSDGRRYDTHAGRVLMREPRFHL